MCDYDDSLPSDLSIAQAARAWGRGLLVAELFRAFGSAGVPVAAITRAYRLLGGQDQSDAIMTKRIAHAAHSLDIRPRPGTERPSDTRRNVPRYEAQDAKQILVDLLEADTHSQLPRSNHREQTRTTPPEQTKRHKQTQLTPDEMDRVKWHLRLSPYARLTALTEGLHDHGHELRDLPALTAKEVSGYRGVGLRTMEVLQDALDIIDRDFADAEG